MCLTPRGRVPGPLGAPGGSTSASSQSGAAIVELIEPEPVFGQSAALQNATLPLFAGEQDGPSPEDMVQGALNNCPVAAILAALAHVAPETVAGMIASSTADVRSRRRSDTPDSLPYRTDRLYTAQFLGGNPVQVSSFLYYTGGAIAYAHSPENCAGWMSYIEKAYAVFRGGGSYNRLNTTTQLGEAPSLNQVMEDLAGPYQFADVAENLLYRYNSDSVALSDAVLRQMLAQADQRVTVAGSRDTAMPEGVVASHAYAVLGRRGNTVLLRNPQGGPDAAVAFSFNEFKTIFRAVLQASPGS